VRVYVLGSGSSGNAIVVEDDGVRVLVDAGIGPRTAAERMRTLGEDLFPRGVDAIVVSHHHGDHAAQLEPLARALRAPKRDHVDERAGQKPLIWLHDGVDVPRVRHRFAVASFVAGGGFDVGPIRVETLRVPHDAPQIAIALHGRDHSVGIVTDVGSVTPKLVDFLGRCNTVLVEANYCPEMLELGPYPPTLKARVRGPLGHLANHEAAQLVAGLRKESTTAVWLCHVSRTNNEPARALATVRARAGDLPVDLLPHGEARLLELLPRKRPSFVQVRLPF
jgi:phosphoribosyl 1,2-cyclic phosphodiesterase